MRLILVRHGQTIENKNEIWQGHLEGTLSKEGEEQAKKLSSRLGQDKIDMIYCSDLQRTRHTIKPFLARYKGPINYVEALRERNLGELEGLTTEKVMAYLDKNNLTLHSKLGTGESYADVRKRLANFYHQVLDKHEGETILFVTHGGSISQLITHLFKYPEDEFRKHVPQNAGVTEIHVKKGKPELKF